MKATKPVFCEDNVISSEDACMQARVVSSEKSDKKFACSVQMQANGICACANAKTAATKKGETAEADRDGGGFGPSSGRCNANAGTVPAGSALPVEYQLNRDGTSTLVQTAPTRIVTTDPLIAKWGASEAVKGRLLEAIRKQQAAMRYASVLDGGGLRKNTKRGV